MCGGQGLISNYAARRKRREFATLSREMLVAFGRCHRRAINARPCPPLAHCRRALGAFLYAAMPATLQALKPSSARHFVLPLLIDAAMMKIADFDYISMPQRAYRGMLRAATRNMSIILDDNVAVVNGRGASATRHGQFVQAGCRCAGGQATKAFSQLRHAACRTASLSNGRERYPGRHSPKMPAVASLESMLRLHTS